MLKLYPIQEYILDNLRETIKFNKRVVLMAGTGSGKTIIATEIIRRVLENKKTCCFVCHRLLLVKQTSKILDKYNIKHSIIQGQNERYYPNRPVQVVSIQTLEKRDMMYFDLIIIDETHVFRKGHKALIEQNPDAFIIGLSATPFRVGLGKYYDQIINPVPVKELIRQKVLKDFEIFGAIPIDLKNVKVRAGEFVSEDLSKAADKPKLTADIVESWLKHAHRRTTVVFCTSVGHGRSLEKEFKKRGIKALEVNGYMRKEDTKEIEGADTIIEKFRQGDIQVIISVEMLIAGFDVTSVDCIVWATATKSLMKWCQGCGRGLRKHEGKDICLILDHGGNTERLGFPDDISIDNLNDGKNSDKKQKKKERPELQIKKCPSCQSYRSPSMQKCPACGIDLRFVEKIETTKGELRKLQRKKNRDYPIEKRQSMLNQINQYCIEKGWNPGSASHKYRAMFGKWPSKLKKGKYEPVQEEVRKFMIHEQIKYAKRINKT